MLRAAARVSLVLLLAAPAVLATANPCSACACVIASPKKLFDRADAAFVGTVVADEPIDAVTTVQTFRVEGVFKGGLGQTVDVIESIGSGGGSSCGIAYPLDTRVAVILYRQGDAWTTDSCSIVSAADLARVAPSPVPPRAASSPSATGAVAPPAPGTAGGLGWRTALVGLLLAVAAIALVVSLGGRHERTRSGVPRASTEADEAEPPLEPPGEPGTEPPADPPRRTR